MELKISAVVAISFALANLNVGVTKMINTILTYLGDAIRVESRTLSPEISNV